MDISWGGEKMRQKRRDGWMRRGKGGRVSGSGASRGGGGWKGGDGGTLGASL